MAAVTIITGAYFGAEAGFVTGALSALISNIFYGQGPWTPFQMLAWGLGGFLSGLVFFNKKLGKATLPLLVVVGFFRRRFVQRDYGRLVGCINDR